MRHLFQRLPLPVPPWSSKIGCPASIAHWSGAIGSTTIFAPAGMFCDHPVARHLARVGLGQHEVVVDAEDEALQRARAPRARARGSRRATRSAREPGRGGDHAPRRRAGRGSGRSAASSARRSATAGRGRGTAGSARARAAAPSRRWRASSAHGAAEREQRRQPAQAPGERRQVVASSPIVLARPSLPPSSPAVSVCFSSPSRNAVVVEQRVRVGGDEARAHQPDRERQVAHAGVRDRRRERRRDHRHEHDPGRVLGRDRDARGRARRARTRACGRCGRCRRSPISAAASGASVGASLSAKWL